MFCISKGLGAPIGSLVCCSEAFSMKIRDKRKLLGGAMRQAGVIAAPGMYALTHNIERLAEDNANAAYAAEQLKDLKNTKVYGKVMSNKQIGKIHLFLNFFHQVQYLCLNRDI